MAMPPHNDPFHDAHEREESSRDGSLEELRPAALRASAYIEQTHISQLPKVWGRESQSGYKGKRVLGIVDDEKGQQANNPSVNILTLDMTGTGKKRISEYELPQRYLGRKPSYKVDAPVPLAGNNNSWTPPPAKKKKRCGLELYTFWVVVVMICLVLLGVAVGGMVYGIQISVHKPSVANVLVAYQTTTDVSTDVSLALSTMTLANGALVVSTQSITSLRTIRSTLSTTRPVTVTTATTATSTAIADTAPVTSTGAGALIAIVNPSSSLVPASTTAFPRPTFTSNTSLLPLACPLLNNTFAKTSILSQTFTYLIICNTDLHSPDLQTVSASSMLDCYNACAQYTHLQGPTCNGVAFHANLSSMSAGNCAIKGDTGAASMYGTGTTNLVALALAIPAGSVSRARMRPRIESKERFGVSKWV